MKNIVKGLLFISILFVLTGCVPGNGTYEGAKQANFLSGIWHGWIAPFSLIYGLIDNNIRIYEVYNTGWWYDFGYYIAVIGGFGGFSFFRKTKKKKD
jgi:hypothetical protein